MIFKNITSNVWNLFKCVCFFLLGWSCGYRSIYLLIIINVWHLFRCVLIRLELWISLRFGSISNPIGYYLLLGGCQWWYDPAAFLFSLVNKPGWPPLKLGQTGQYSQYRKSIYSCSKYGPIFGGGHDIYIANHASSNTDSQANLGYTYIPPARYGSSFAQSFLAGSTNGYKFQPDEVEVFYETTWRNCRVRSLKTPCTIKNYTLKSYKLNINHLKQKERNIRKLQYC